MSNELKTRIVRKTYFNHLTNELVTEETVEEVRTIEELAKTLFEKMEKQREETRKRAEEAPKQEAYFKGLRDGSVGKYRGEQYEGTPLWEHYLRGNHAGASIND